MCKRLENDEERGRNVKKQWVKRTMMKGVTLAAITSTMVVPLAVEIAVPVYAIADETPILLSETVVGTVNYSFQRVGQQINWSVLVKANQEADYLRLNLSEVDQLSLGSQIIQKDDTGWFVFERVPNQAEYQLEFQTLDDQTNISMAAELASSNDEGELEVLELVKEGNLVAEEPMSEIVDVSPPLEEIESPVIDSPTLEEEENPLSPVEEAGRPSNNELMGFQPFAVSGGISNQVLVNGEDIAGDPTKFARPGDTVTFVTNFTFSQAGNDRTWTGTIDPDLYEMESVSAKHKNLDANITINRETGKFTWVTTNSNRGPHEISITAQIASDTPTTDLASFLSHIESNNGKANQQQSAFQIKAYSTPVLSWQKDFTGETIKSESKDMAELSSNYSVSFYWQNLEECELKLFKVSDGSNEEELTGKVIKDTEDGSGTINLATDDFSYDTNTFELRVIRKDAVVTTLTLIIEVTGSLQLVTIPDSLAWSGTVASMKGTINRNEDNVMQLEVQDSRQGSPEFYLTASYQSTTPTVSQPFSLVWKNNAGDTGVDLDAVRLTKDNFEQTNYTYSRLDTHESGVLLRAEEYLPVGEYTGTITWTLTDTVPVR